MNETLRAPVLIIGGGIAGLWLLRRLESLGIEALLIEKNAIGSGQTIASQGIIHGGMKFALTGHLTNSASAASQMTERWQQCFQGKGEIDLSQVNFLSSSHYMWLKSSGSGLKSFISSKVLSSNNEILAKEHYPALFKNPKVTGHLCKLYETVVDVPSLLQTLARPVEERILQGSEKSSLLFNKEGEIESVTLERDERTLTLHAKHYLFCAGLGNEGFFSSQIPLKLAQKRPLKMVWVTFNEQAPDEAFAHIVEKGSTPTLTITTHINAKQKTVWYLGGELAESGIHRSDEEQIVHAKNELMRLLPWVNLQGASFHVHYIERSENENGGKRPSDPFVNVHKNSLICWPTKLTLAPALSDMVLSQLDLKSLAKTSVGKIPEWPKATIAKPLWDNI
jgi:glycerol-3-phosphate dehydrogenase